jgi:nicotinamidase/pyrazinamidase
MKAAFFCVDAQQDFMYHDGKLYVPGAESLLLNISALTMLAMREDIPVIASTDIHTNHDPEFKLFPPHCIELTPGAALIREACLGVGTGKAPRSIPDVIITKQTYDVFSNPLTAKIVKAVNAKQWFVYGVATDYCVRAAVLGLRKMGRKVNVVTDAIMGVAKDCSGVISEMRAAGANFVSCNYVESAIK